MTELRAALPPGMTVFQRGWLSANNILFHGAGRTALVDSGYCSHSRQTLSLVDRTLGSRALDLLLNTHLHSDHCGGNAALQAAYPQMQTLIPPGQAYHVRNWDPVALTYVPTGQECPQFKMDGVLEPGRTLLLADVQWQVHSSPGHDPHSIVLFEPVTRTLIAADALWENGFGVVFQELEGEHAFGEVARTLDVIEALGPRTVIPGHGQVFTDVKKSLEAARRRLDSFANDPRRHAAHAAKVLLKFKLLDLQQMPIALFTKWAIATPYFKLVHDRFFPDVPLQDWVEQLLDDLVRIGAARSVGSVIYNT
jgi:glyoxylase-like metal-dependent hydrolase (beta-lactamase superfamily II)